MLAFVFDLLPVLLAMLVAPACAYRYARERRRRPRRVMLLGMVCALLLMVAQTSWWTSWVVQGLGVGTRFADVVWTAFNCLVMVSFLLLAQPWSAE